MKPRLVLACMAMTVLLALSGLRLKAQTSEREGKHVRDRIVNLGTLGGSSSAGNGINNLGWIAGFSSSERGSNG